MANIKPKPKYSLNIETLLSEQGLTGKALAAMIPTSEQTISKVRSGIRISMPIARRINELFPEYNLSWILGESDYKTNEEIKQLFDKVHEIEEREAVTKKNDFFSAVANIAVYCGFGAQYDGKTLIIEERPRAYPDDDVEGINLDVECDCYELIEDLVAFMNYRLQKAIERGR